MTAGEASKGTPTARPLASHHALLGHVWGSPRSLTCATVLPFAQPDFAIQRAPCPSRRHSAGACGHESHASHWARKDHTLPTRRGPLPSYGTVWSLVPWISSTATGRLGRQGG